VRRGEERRGGERREGKRRQGKKRRRGEKKEVGTSVTRHNSFNSQRNKRAHMVEF
jgi:hypothetical protein